MWSRSFDLPCRVAPDSDLRGVVETDAEVLVGEGHDGPGTPVDGDAVTPLVVHAVVAADVLGGHGVSSRVMTGR